MLKCIVESALSAIAKISLKLYGVITCVRGEITKHQDCMVITIRLTYGMCTVDRSGLAVRSGLFRSRPC